MISDETKRMIDALSMEELRLEIEKANRSRFQGDNYAYIKTRLAILKEQEQTTRRQQDVTQTEEQIALARKANQIAKDANSLSKWAITFSALSTLIALVALFSALNRLFPPFLESRMYSDWKPLVYDHPISEGKKISLPFSVEELRSDLPIPDIKRISGEAKFIKEDHATNDFVRLGYKILIDAAAVDLSKVPEKYRKEKPVDIGGGVTITQLPIVSVTHEIRFTFILKDKDGFELLKSKGEPEDLESGKANMYQRILSDRVSSSIARRTSKIVFGISVEKCVTCQ